MTPRLRDTGILLTVGLAALWFPGTARPELIEQRIGQEPIRLTYGTGTTRLDGMGLRIAAPDENDEINLFDFGNNPAGLLADRDAWSVDFRMAHQEYVERDPRLSGFDYKGNTYSFLGAYRRTSDQAFGGGYDLIQSNLKRNGESRSRFDNIRYRFLYNRLFGPASFGFEFRYENEVEDLQNPGRLYYIEHNTDAFTGVAGLSYPVHEYVTVAARGDIRRSTVNGTAQSDEFLDKFDWNRPKGSADAQVFVTHPRLKGGLTVGKLKGAGEENVEIGWSPLFLFNPTLRFVRFEREPLTEKASTDRLSTRWEYEAVPGLFSVAGAFRSESSSNLVVAVPTVSGSESSSDVDSDYSDFGLGGNLLLAGQRLFVGGEFHSVNDKVTDHDPLDGFILERTTSTFSVGAEYLLFENLAIRNGWAVRSEDRKASSGNETLDLGLTGTYSATTASFGVGLVPRGAALQLDAAYSVDLSSDLDIDRSGFSMYARLLF